MAEAIVMMMRKFFPFFTILAISLAISTGSLGAAGPAKNADLHPGLSAFDYDKGLQKALSEQKFTMIYFWTPSCEYCRLFSAEVLTDPAVIETLNRSFVVVSLNADRERKLARKYLVRAVPNLVFLDQSGQPASVLPGVVPVDVFIVFLNYINSYAYLDKSFLQYIEN
jgi:thioredoxin-related protein